MIASVLFLAAGFGALALLGPGVPGARPVEAAKAAIGGAPASSARANGITLSIVCLGRAATRVGTPGRDTIVGTRRRDVIAGLGGGDVIKGMGGNDLICGGGGGDRLAGGFGRDRMDGGRGRDSCSGGSGRDRARRCERKYGI